MSSVGLVGVELQDIFSELSDKGGDLLVMEASLTKALQYLEGDKDEEFCSEIPTEVFFSIVEMVNASQEAGVRQVSVSNKESRAN